MEKIVTQGETGKRIPINWAKKIAEDLGYTQVIIHGYDGNTGIQHVTTFGESLADCEHAAKGGNVIKHLLGFPEEASKAVPARIKRKNQNLRQTADDAFEAGCDYGINLTDGGRKVPTKEEYLTQLFGEGK